MMSLVIFLMLVLLRSVLAPLLLIATVVLFFALPCIRISSGAVTGGVIPSGGSVFAATFAVLAVLPLMFLAELGFAVAFGVLLDTVVRSILVPALAYEIGKAIWWPLGLA